MIRGSVVLIWSMAWSTTFFGQNLVPNPSFEELDACVDEVNPHVTCLIAWSDFLDMDPVNTPDLGYEGALFFPPSSIDAFEGDQYLNLECSTGNPEYAQVSLIQPMMAGTSYCVSFYASVNDQSTEVAPSMGVYFATDSLTGSPFELGLQAHVQGPVDFDPTAWTLISGTYIAQGGEDVMVVAGFENVGTMPFPYMYIDMISVVPMPGFELDDVQLCDGPVVLNAFAQGATYTWSNGSTTASIEVSEPGSYSVVRTIGQCAQEATAEVLACDEEDDGSDPDDTGPVDPDPEEETGSEEIEEPDFAFYIPNAFTPDGDGTNDVFVVVGPVAETFLLQVFNRWGQVVFETDDIRSAWTGNHGNGNYYVPDGIYTYHVKASRGMDIFEAQGHVVLLR